MKVGVRTTVAAGSSVVGVTAGSPMFAGGLSILEDISESDCEHPEISKLKIVTVRRII